MGRREWLSGNLRTERAQRVVDRRPQAAEPADRAGLADPLGPQDRRTRCRGNMGYVDIAAATLCGRG